MDFFSYVFETVKGAKATQGGCERGWGWNSWAADSGRAGAEDFER